MSLLLGVSDPGLMHGTASLAFGQSGSLSGSNGTLVGTTSLTFAQTGAVAGAGALAGTATITFGQTGSLHGDEALSGTAAMVFGQTGLLAGAGAISGTATATFGQTGALGGNGALAGSLPIVFGQSGDLTNSSGTGAITGTTGFAFGQSGALTGAGVLTGSTTLTFGQSGVMESVTHGHGAFSPLSPAAYEVEFLRWGFLQVTPDKVFDFILETEPREQPRPAEPVAAPVEPQPQIVAVASFVEVSEPIPQDVDLGWEPLHGYARSLVTKVYLDMQPVYREKRRIAAKYVKAAAEHDKELIKAYLAKKGKTTWA